MIHNDDGFTFIHVGSEMCESKPGGGMWQTFEVYSLK